MVVERSAVAPVNCKLRLSILGGGHLLVAELCKLLSLQRLVFFPFSHQSPTWSVQGSICKPTL